MENGKETVKTEEQADAKTGEVKTEEKPVEKTAEAPSEELLERVRNQIEFYFGNVNMQRDKFLIEQTKLDEGWVPLNLMLNFKMLASMTTDVEVILKALESSDLMETSEDKKKIRRSPKHPLPVYDEQYRKAQEARTIYLKGFPLENMTIEKLKKFFEQYEPFENIIMRKYQDKDKKLHFKGSIFVQFTTLDDAKAFMTREGVKYEETELIKKWSVDYAADKAKEKEEIRKKKDKKAEKADNKGNDDEKKNDSKKDKELPKGSLIFISGLSDTTTREDIKGVFGTLGADIAYVEFNKGDTEGWIRLQGENAAEPVLKKTTDNKVTIGEKEVTCKIVDGEEEEKYLAKAWEDMTSLRQKSAFKSNRGRKGQKRGGGRGGARKRRQSPAKDATPAKKSAVE